MNFNTLNPTSRVLKKLQNYASGQTAKDAPSIAIINASDSEESKKLTNNVIAGIISAGGVVYTHNVPYFGYANRISPMTAKFAPAFRDFAKNSATAIIKTNMVEGVVIVSDCAVTTAGLLEGCLIANCPAMVLPIGRCNIANVEATHRPVTQIAGSVVGGVITSAQLEELIVTEYMPKFQSDFFSLLEKLGFVVPNASYNKRGSGAQLLCAIETGKVSVKNTAEMLMPKKIFTKKSSEDVVDYCISKKLAISELSLLFRLFDVNDVKISNDLIFERMAKLAGSGVSSNIAKMTGTALGGLAYVQFNGEKHPQIKGKAWCYQTLEDADRALCSGSVNSGIVVLQNCVGIDVSSIANVILGMKREGEIAIATDGVCEVSDILCVQFATPTSYENEEFANIQNGDILTVDVSMGRFNSDVLAKELNGRAKRNTIKKPVTF